MVLNVNSIVFYHSIPVQAAPEPCGNMMPYYSLKKPEKSINSPIVDKERMEKDKKKELLKKLEKSMLS